MNHGHPSGIGRNNNIMWRWGRGGGRTFIMDNRFYDILKQYPLFFVENIFTLRKK